jgi:hypothetical protein
MASEQMALQFAQIQEKSNNDLVKNLTAGLGKKLSTGFSSVVGSVKTMTKTAAGNLEDKLEARKAEKVKSAREEKWRATQDKFFGFMKTKWSSIAENKKVQAAGGFLKKMLIGLLGGFALFALPPDFWTGLKNMIFDFGKWIASISWEKDIKPMLLSIKNAVVAVKDFINTIIDKIFGKKDDKGVRQEGLLGKGGLAATLFGDDGAATMSKFVAGIGIATAALATMFPGKAIKLVAKGIWGLTKGLAGGAKAVGSKGLSMLAGGAEAKFDRAGGAGDYLTDAQKKMSQSRSDAFNAGSGSKVAKGGGGWFKKLMGKFGKAGKFLMKMGKSVIKGLMTMGPYGWAILAGIALGGLVWYFWDDVVKVWDSVSKSISEGFGKVKQMVMGAFGNVQGMVGGWLRGIGAGMIADWIDPKGADPGKEPEEFTWGKFAGDLWKIYSGMWTKIFGAVKKLAGKIGDFGLSTLKFIGAPGWLIDMLGGGDEPDKPSLTEEREEGMGKEYAQMSQEERNQTQKKVNAADTKKKRGSAGAAVSKGDVAGIESEMEATGVEYSNLMSKGASTPGFAQEKARLGKKMGQLRSDKIAAMESNKAVPLPKTKNSDIGGGGDTGVDHDGVGVSNANMGKVAWDKIGGREGIESAITGVYNKHGIKQKPTFTSGYRGPEHFLTKANPNSQHPKGTAFDLRSANIPTDKKGAVFADLRASFGSGIWGQHEIGSVNKGKRTGEHFHFQAAAQGFQGVVDKATIFLVGEGGAEMVNVTPLNSPQGRTSAMNTMQSENAQGKMGSGNAPTIVSAPQSTTVNNQSSTVLAMSPTAKNTFWDNAT